MSEHWSPPAPGMRLKPGPISTTFTPWAERLRPQPPVAPDLAEQDLGPTAPIDMDSVALDAFANGFEEGRRIQQAEFAGELAALRRLAATLESLRPEPPAALAVMIAETVGRLVRQVVGEAAVDAPLLLARATAVAALVTEEARPVRMRMRPEDVALLGENALAVELLPDPTLMPGAILLETRDGWVEHGVATALDRLRVQLDAMGLPR